MAVVLSPVDVARPSLIVLPFTSLGDNSVDAYIVDGLADAVITDLSCVVGVFRSPGIRPSTIEVGMTPVLLYYLRYWPYKYDTARALMRKGLEKVGLRD